MIFLLPKVNTSISPKSAFNSAYKEAEKVILEVRTDEFERTFLSQSFAFNSYVAAAFRREILLLAMTNR